MTKRSVLFLGFALLGGCVERVLTIQSDPPGALVYVNQQEIGRTPLQKNFTWYGNYAVTLRKDGYDTLKTNGPVHPPVWQWPVIDLFVEVLPLRFKDEHTLQYTLKPARQETETDLLQRADELKGKLESGQAAPTTQASSR